MTQTHAFRPAVERLDDRALPSAPALSVSPPAAPVWAVTVHARTLADALPTDVSAARQVALTGELTMTKLKYFPRNSTYQFQLTVSAQPPLARSLPVKVTFYWSDTADDRGGRTALAATEPDRRSEGKQTEIYNKKFSELTRRPAWAKFLVAVVDEANEVREKYESNNRISVRL